MSKTRSDLITRVLEYIGAKDPQDVTDPHDAASIGDVVDSIFERLQEEGAVTFDLNTIPNRVYMPLVYMVGGEAPAIEFKLSPQRVQELTAFGVFGREEFYRTQAHEPTDERVKVVFY